MLPTRIIRLAVAVVLVAAVVRSQTFAVDIENGPSTDSTSVAGSGSAGFVRNNPAWFCLQ